MPRISLKVLVIVLFLMNFNTPDAHAQSERSKIDRLIEQKRDFNKNNRSSTVFKIQLFNGNEKEALEIRERFEEEFPDYKTILLYRAPEWKTQVGMFKTRLEADKVLLKIRKEFPGAIVLEDRI